MPVKPGKMMSAQGGRDSSKSLRDSQFKSCPRKRVAVVNHCVSRSILSTVGSFIGKDSEWIGGQHVVYKPGRGLSWQVLSRGPSGDGIATSCRHMGPDLTKIAQLLLLQYVWASGALSNHMIVLELFAIGRSNLVDPVEGAKTWFTKPEFWEDFVDLSREKKRKTQKLT